jgi:hypothetical protein
MPIRANYDPRFYRRFIIIGMVAVGFALFCLYDGFIRYPAQRARAYEQFKELVGEDRLDEWEQYAEQTEVKGDGDIMMQYLMAAVTGAIGFWLLWGVWRARGRWIESSESGLTSSWGQNVDFDQIVALDKRKWRSKGIAKVTYNDGRRNRRFILDDYKFDRASTGQILREMEARIDPDMITGGPPESVDDELAASSEEHLSAEPERVE